MFNTSFLALFIRVDADHNQDEKYVGAKKNYPNGSSKFLCHPHSNPTPQKQHIQCVFLLLLKVAQCYYPTNWLKTDSLNVTHYLLH